MGEIGEAVSSSTKVESSRVSGRENLLKNEYEYSIFGHNLLDFRGLNQVKSSKISTTLQVFHVLGSSEVKLKLDFPQILP